MAKIKVMLVDDEVTFTRLTKLSLEATGHYEVETENLGREAFGAAKAFLPDIIFLDIIMRDIEGSEVAEQFRADPILKKIPLVFLTATVSREEVGMETKVIGGNPFLAKPVTLEQLVKTIRQYVR